MTTDRSSRVYFAMVMPFVKARTVLSSQNAFESRRHIAGEVRTKDANSTDWVLYIVESIPATSRPVW